MNLSALSNEAFLPIKHSPKRTETHFSLKHTDLRFPEVIRQLKTASCRNCNLPEKKQALDEVSLAMIQVFPKPVPEPRKMVEQEAETLEQEPKLETSKELKEQPLKPAQTTETKPSSLPEKPEKPDETETAESTKPEKLEEDIRKEDQSEKKLQPDPVEVALPEPKILTKSHGMSTMHSLHHNCLTSPIHCRFSASGCMW